MSVPKRQRQSAQKPHIFLPVPNRVAERRREIVIEPFIHSRKDPDHVDVCLYDA
jgi:hypothetical protein